MESLTEFLDKLEVVASEDLEAISTSNNILDVLGYMDRAVLKAFDLWDVGSQREFVRSSGGDVGGFELAVLERRKLFSLYVGDVYRRLVSYIPKRLRSSGVYFDFVSRLP